MARGAEPKMIPTLHLLLDHDNIDFDRFPIRHILTEWITSLSAHLVDSRILTVRVRSYGGWFHGATVSESRYSAAQFYQTQMPSAFTVGNHLCRLSFDFADHLYLGEGDANRVKVTHTVVERSKPDFLTFRKPRHECVHPECTVSQVRKWLRRARACFHPDCPLSFADVFVRLEQKQVDVHLALDLVFIGEVLGDGDHLAVVSDDIDLLPALVAAGRRRKSGKCSLSLVRCQEPPAYLVDTLTGEEVQLFIIQEVGHA